MPTTYTAKVRHTGLSFGEAPRWHGGRLWYSDFYRHGVFSLGDDGERLELTVATQPSGLGWQPDGTLLVVSMTDHVVLAVGADGVARPHADISEYCGYWANDMVVAADGTAYVGNFGFDLDTWVEELELARGGRADPADRHHVGGRDRPRRHDRPGRRRAALPERHGARRRRHHPHRRGVPRSAAHRLRRRRGRHPVGSTRLRRARRPARRHLPRRGGPGLGRQPARTAVRARRGGRRGHRDGDHGAELLRLHARRRGPSHAAI